MIFDTHAHYDDDAYDIDREELLSVELPKSIEGVVSIGASMSTTFAARDLAHKYDYITFAAGIHPEGADSWSKENRDKLYEIAKDDRCVAIGEIGLDYYWPVEETKRAIKALEEETAADETLVTVKRIKSVDVNDPLVKVMQSGRAMVFNSQEEADKYDAKVLAIKNEGARKLADAKESQAACFKGLLDIAKELNKPVVIHSRDACEDTLTILKEYTASIDTSVYSPGVVHCFSYSPEIAKIYTKMGYYIGVGGVLTYPNARKLVETVEAIPLERIVLETDCPYLSPTPYRGERNDSRTLQCVAEKLAELKGVSVEEVIRITTENAYKMYRITR